MKYILIFFISFFSLAFGMFDPDPPQCIDGAGHVRYRYLYSLRDTTGLTYSFDTTFQDRRDEDDISYTDTIEWLVIPAGWDTLVWQCARCDSIQYESSDTVRQIARIMEEVKAVSDLTPDAVDWDDNSGSLFYTSNIEKITGIDNSITLKIEFSGTYDQSDEFYIYTNTINSERGATGTLITTSGQTITIAPDLYVYFTFNNGTGGYLLLDIDFTIKNNSDSDTTLDTISVWSFADL